MTGIFSSLKLIEAAFLLLLPADIKTGRLAIIDAIPATMRTSLNTALFLSGGGFGFKKLPTACAAMAF